MLKPSPREVISQEFVHGANSDHHWQSGPAMTPANQSGPPDPPAKSSRWIGVYFSTISASSRSSMTPVMIDAIW